MSKPAKNQPAPDTATPAEVKPDIKGPGIAVSSIRIGKGYNLDLPEMRGFATGSDVLQASDEVAIVFYPRLQQYIITTPKRPRGVFVDTAGCSADLA